MNTKQIEACVELVKRIRREKIPINSNEARNEYIDIGLAADDIFKPSPVEKDWAQIAQAQAATLTEVKNLLMKRGY